MADENGRQTRTGGREATTGHIPGDFALSVGMPQTTAPSGWQWTRLTNVARLETGHTPSRKHPEYWGGDVPWVGIRDATANHGRTLYDTNQHTNELGINNSSARVLPKNTVCLSRTASVGYVVVMGKPMATSQDFVNWVCSEKLDYRFLKYVLLSENRSFLRFASGTTHQTIYFPEVKAFHICLPPLDEQHAIAGILGALDDKIELNRRMNETLEAMARAIFKSWFVDFDPVRAKLDGRQPPGMDAETAALFPDSFEHVDGEPVPRGWQAASIKERADAIQYGYTASSTNKPVGPRFLRITDIRGGHVAWGQVPFCEADSATAEKYRVEEGDVFVARTGASTGENIYIVDPPNAVFASYLVRFKFSNRGVARFVGEYMRTPDYFGYVLGCIGGSAQPNASAQALAGATTVFPPDELVLRFYQRVKPMDDARARNDQQSATLVATRDALLPKLLSGKIRVSDAESVVGNRA